MLVIRKTYKQPTVAPLKNQTKINTVDQIMALVEMNHMISLAFKTFS